MADVTYAIVFSGEIVEGFQAISVKAHLAKMLKASPKKIETLFSGKTIVMKRTADKAEAAKYGSALKKVGADVRVKIIKSDASTPAPRPAATPITPSPTTPPQATPPQATTASVAAPTPVAIPINTSSLSLAPNEGNIVESALPVPAPKLDLSNMSILENDGTPLVAPKQAVKVDIDLSSFSVAENDGAPLIEPQADITPKVEVPDFGLDEPGAVLETLKIEVEQVHPDTSGMSLAFPGSDLLNPEQRDQGPPPVAPDTSKLSVVATRAVFGD
jgi:hypothetical protein